MDRWLRHRDGRALVAVSCVVSLVAYPVWLFVPGVGATIVLAVPVSLAAAPIWPLVRARALAAVPGKAGTVLALTSLFGALPLSALFGALGARLGLTAPMLGVHVGATLLLLAVVGRAAR